MDSRHGLILVPYIRLVSLSVIDLLILVKVRTSWMIMIILWLPGSVAWLDWVARYFNRMHIPFMIRFL